MSDQHITPEAVTADATADAATDSAASFLTVPAQMIAVPCAEQPLLELYFKDTNETNEKAETGNAAETGDVTDTVDILDCTAVLQSADVDDLDDVDVKSFETEAAMLEDWTHMMADRTTSLHLHPAHPSVTAMLRKGCICGKCKDVDDAAAARPDETIQDTPEMTEMMWSRRDALDREAVFRGLATNAPVEAETETETETSEQKTNAETKTKAVANSKTTIKTINKANKRKLDRQRKRKAKKAAKIEAIAAAAAEAVAIAAAEAAAETERGLRRKAERKAARTATHNATMQYQRILSYRPDGMEKKCAALELMTLTPSVPNAQGELPSFPSQHLVVAFASIRHHFPSKSLEECLEEAQTLVAPIEASIASIASSAPSVSSASIVSSAPSARPQLSTAALQALIEQIESTESADVNDVTKTNTSMKTDTGMESEFKIHTHMHEHFDKYNKYNKYTNAVGRVGRVGRLNKQLNNNLTAVREFDEEALREFDEEVAPADYDASPVYLSSGGNVGNVVRDDGDDWGDLVDNMSSSIGHKVTVLPNGDVRTDAYVPRTTYHRFVATKVTKKTGTGPNTKTSEASALESKSESKSANVPKMNAANAATAVARMIACAETRDTPDSSSKKSIVEANKAAKSYPIMSRTLVSVGVVSRFHNRSIEFAYFSRAVDHASTRIICGKRFYSNRSTTTRRTVAAFVRDPITHDTMIGVSVWHLSNGPDGPNGPLNGKGKGKTCTPPSNAELRTTAITRLCLSPFTSHNLCPDKSTSSLEFQFQLSSVIEARRRTGKLFDKTTGLAEEERRTGFSVRYGFYKYFGGHYIDARMDPMGIPTPDIDALFKFQGYEYDDMDLEKCYELFGRLQYELKDDDESAVEAIEMWLGSKHQHE